MESTVRPWMKKYKLGIKVAPTAAFVKIGEKRGRPIYLSDEVDAKLWAMLISLKTAGGIINVHTVRGVLMGLIKSDLVKNSRYLEFGVTRSWERSLYQRMNLSRRAVTTSRPIITNVLYKEIKSLFLQDIVSEVLSHNIPDSLIINVDQTPSNYVPTDNITMAVTGSKHVTRKGANNKRAITVTLSETLSGEILPFQMIYKGKTERSLPKISFPSATLPYPIISNIGATKQRVSVSLRIF